MSQIWDLVLIGTKALKWSQISPSSARKSQISFQKMLRSLGLGLGLETFAKFLRVSVSVWKNLVSEKKSRFRKNLVSEEKYQFRFRKNLVSEKILGFGFGKFGLGRKVSVSVSEKFGLLKKSRFRKNWYRKKSLGIGFGQNFGIVIQCTIVITIIMTMTMITI